MTSKLKYNVYCPFCGEGLLFWGATGSMRKCPKCDNNLLGNKEIWQALIQAKQDLEIARKALEDIASGQIIEHSVFGHESDNKIAIARNALEQIEHKEQI